MNRSAAPAAPPAHRASKHPAPAPAPATARIESLPLAKALNRGLRDSLADDDRVLLIGEDIGTLGGVFRVTEGLQREFGRHRVIDSPLA